MYGQPSVVYGRAAKEKGGIEPAAVNPLRFQRTPRALSGEKKGARNQQVKAKLSQLGLGDQKTSIHDTIANDASDLIDK